MTSRILVCIITLTCLFNASTALSTVIYVKWDAGGANNGTTWTDAYTDLQTAIGASNPGDSIWVAKGTYKPTSGTDRTIAFDIDHLNLYGGFAGTESSVEERDIPANPTILSGDIGEPMKFSDNSNRVVRSVVLESSFTLDGFTIRDGNAQTPTGAQYGGGGYFDEPAGAVFRNLVFEDNFGGLGGGAYVNDCKGCSWDNVIFQSNSAARGGGLFHDKGIGSHDHIMTNAVFDSNTTSVRGGGASISYMTLTDVLVSGNISEKAGGLSVTGCSLTRITLIGNEATEYGGGIEDYFASGTVLHDCEFRSNTAPKGGGLYSTGRRATQVTGTDFIGNHATDNGGAVCLEGFADFHFVSCTMDSNTADGYGGAVYAAGPEPNFESCEMHDNIAARGGAIAASDAGTIITATRCTLAENTANDFHGGALYAAAGGEIIAGSSLITDNNAVRFGGGACVDNGEIILVNSTLYGNSAGIRGGAAASFSEGTINISNSILWNNSALYNPVCYCDDPLSVIIIDHSDIEGSGGSVAWDTSYGTDGGANIDADPMFVNAAGGDFHLTVASPCIERGDQYNPLLPAEDLDGNPRIIGVKPDMGCYESSNYCPGVARLYVNALSSVNGPGTSWVDAFQRLDDALATVQLCAGINQIWVAEGTYLPTLDADRTSSFALVDSIAIYGGFAGTENSLPERHLADHISILSGEIGAAGVDDNSYHVVTCSGVSGETVLDGFTITGGNADAGYPNDRGGGMYNFIGAPTIRNVIFTGNKALTEGGGLSSILGAGIRLINVLFTENSAFQNGGALASNANSSVLTNVTFYGNSSVLGAVIYNNNCNPAFVNCILWGNPVPLLPSRIASWRVPEAAAPGIPPSAPIWETTWIRIRISSTARGETCTCR
jgi:predicted outer membrane repeat protein